MHRTTSGELSAAGRACEAAPRGRPVKNPFTFPHTSSTVTNADRRSVCGASKHPIDKNSTFEWSVGNIKNNNDCIYAVLSSTLLCFIDIGEFVSFKQGALEK